MNGTQSFQSGAVDAFQGTNPQFQIGVDGILDQYRNVYTFQRIGQFLYSKRVGGSTGTYPKDIDACLQTFVNMLGSSYFGGYQHTCFLFDTFQPCQTVNTNTFKTTRLGTRFPDTCAEDFGTFLCKLVSSIHNLFFGFCTTWTGNDDGSLFFYTC